MAGEWVSATSRPPSWNGVESDRKLYFSQPKRGIPSLEPGQLIEVLKGVFGLSTSPKLWWMKLSKEVLTIEIHHQGLHLTMKQNEIDPCVFMVCSQSTETTVHGLLLTHVDDIMLMAERELVLFFCRRPSRIVFLLTSGSLMSLNMSAVSTSAPNRRWESRRGITPLAESTRSLRSPGAMAPLAGSRLKRTEQRLEACHGYPSKRDLIWASAWVRLRKGRVTQNDPSQEDIKKTNKAVDAALNFKDEGITLKKSAWARHRLCGLSWCCGGPTSHTSPWRRTMWTGQGLIMCVPN